MITDFVCKKECGGVILDKFYHLRSHMLKDEEVLKCPKCGSSVMSIFGSYHVSSGGEVMGYEKENQDHLTLGKAIDGRQKWV